MAYNTARISTSDATTRLFEALLDDLAGIDAFSGPKSPSIFMVYAHDCVDDDNVRVPPAAYSDTVKSLIKWLQRVRSRTLSDRHPLPEFEHEGRATGEAACRDILANQFCLLPGLSSSNEVFGNLIETVDKVVVCGSPRLQQYYERPFAAEYIHAISRVFASNRQASVGELRHKVLQECLEPATGHPEFHHVLTELAFVEVRNKYSSESPGIILASLDSSLMSYLHFLDSTHIRLKFPPDASPMDLHERFFKTLRLIYTTKHATIGAYEAAYTGAKTRLQSMGDFLTDDGVDSAIRIARKRAREDLTAHELAQLRNLQHRKELLNSTDDLGVRRNQLLGKLATLPYQDRKDRNMRRVPGTCEWFTRHPIFRAWWHDKTTSGLLWVSAYPGCGKSVLLRYLIDEYLIKPDCTVCYFFFKDDFNDQKSAIDALRCIIHQILVRRPELLTVTVLEQFEQDAQLLQSLAGLWNILLKIADSQTSGEIVCVFDALDECLKIHRDFYIKALVEWSKHANQGSRLRVLVSSRLYNDIRHGFHEISTQIHLSGEGEDEMEEISHEINLVIQARIQDIAPRLGFTPHQSRFLEDELTQVPNKTYLWAHLVFEEVQNIVETDEESLQSAVRTLPRTAYESYEKILSRSSNPERVKRMLSILIAAKEPLTVKQLAEAWAVKPGLVSYKELQIVSDSQFIRMVHGLCGLFVIVVDERVYLLHQTAREFLLAPGQNRVQPQTRVPLAWAGCISIEESELMLAHLCVDLLLLRDLPRYGIDSLFTRVETTTSEKESGSMLILKFKKLENEGDEQSSLIARRRLLSEGVVFAWYAALHWVAHVRDATRLVDEVLLSKAASLCDPVSPTCQKWLKEFKLRVGHWPEGPEQPSHLMFAAMLGLSDVVAWLLLSRNANVGYVDESSNYDAASCAAIFGHTDVVQLLLKHATDHRSAPLSLPLRDHSVQHRGFGDQSELSTAILNFDTHRGTSLVRPLHSSRLTSTESQPRQTDGQMVISRKRRLSSPGGFER